MYIYAIWVGFSSFNHFKEENVQNSVGLMIYLIKYAYFKQKSCRRFWTKTMRPQTLQNIIEVCLLGSCYTDYGTVTLVGSCYTDYRAITLTRELLPY